MHPLLNLAVTVAVLFGPPILFWILTARIESKLARLVIATALALADGCFASYAAAEFGWRATTRSGRMLNLAPQELFWAISSSMWVVLLLFAFSKRTTLTRAPGGIPHGTPPPASRPEPGPPPSAGAPPPLPAAPARRLKIAFWILVGIYCAALLAWPFLSYIAVFAFDSPHGNPFLGFYILLSVWGYPLFVAAGFFWGHPKRNRSLPAVLLKTSVPLLSAVWFFIFGMIGSILLMPKIPGFTMNPAALIRRNAELKERLDPIYVQKAAAVRARNPEQDAAEALRRGEAALLPTIRNGDIFPGIDFRRHPVKSPAENFRAIEASPLLSGIQAGFELDPSHDLARDNYFSPVFKDFLNASNEYRARFNQLMEPHVAWKKEDRY